MFFLLFVSSSHLPTPPLAVVFFFEFLGLVFLLLLLPFTTYSTTTTLECWPAAFSSPDELVVASSFVNAFQMNGPPDRKGRKKKKEMKKHKKNTRATQRPCIKKQFYKYVGTFTPRENQNAKTNDNWLNRKCEFQRKFDRITRKKKHSKQ